jgi:hypothetical protein
VKVTVQLVLDPESAELLGLALENLYHKLHNRSELDPEVCRRVSDMHKLVMKAVLPVVKKWEVKP